MKRHDRFWLTDILDAANLVSQFVGGHSLESFQDDVLTRSAVLHKLTVIGEAARHISIDVRRKKS